MERNIKFKLEKVDVDHKEYQFSIIFDEQLNKELKDRSLTISYYVKHYIIRVYYPQLSEHFKLEIVSDENNNIIVDVYKTGKRTTVKVTKI